MAGDVLESYVEKMKRLKIDRAHGPAPHKPALLLSVIALIESGEIEENRITVTRELAEMFAKYWVRVTERQPNIAMPFFHLRRDGFWHLRANPGYETVLEVTSSIRTMRHLREVISHVTLDDELFELLGEAEGRAAIRRVLIEMYFPDSEEAIERLIAEERRVRECVARLYGV